MDLIGIVRVVMRRKLVVLPVMCLSVAMVAYVVTSIPPVYRASGTIVLFNPPSAPDPDRLPPTATTVNASNPFTRFGDLAVVADIISRIVDSAEVREQLLFQGVTGNYEVSANQDFFRGPIIEFAAEEATPEAAIASTTQVMSAFTDTLQERQERFGTHPDYFIRVEEVVPPSKASRVAASTVRAGVAAVALGILLTLASGVIAEAIANRTRPSKRRLRASEEDSTSNDEPADLLEETVDAKATASLSERPRRRNGTHRGAEIDELEDASARRAVDEPVADRPATPDPVGVAFSSTPDHATEQAVDSINGRSAGKHASVLPLRASYKK